MKKVWLIALTAFFLAFDSTNAFTVTFDNSALISKILSSSDVDSGDTFLIASGAKTSVDESWRAEKSEDETKMLLCWEGNTISGVGGSTILMDVFGGFKNSIGLYRASKSTGSAMVKASSSGLGAESASAVQVDETPITENQMSSHVTTVTTVREPAVMLLLGIGLITVAYGLRKNLNAQNPQKSFRTASKSVYLRSPS